MAKNMTLRLDYDMYEELRKEAFEQRTTITQIIRDAIEKRHNDSN